MDIINHIKRTFNNNFSKTSKKRYYISVIFTLYFLVIQHSFFKIRHFLTNNA